MKKIPMPLLLGPAAAVSHGILSAPRACAATFSLNPSMDAFVTTGPTGNLSTNNYGGAGVIAVSAAGLPKGEFQSALQFDLSAAKAAFDSQFGAGQWTIQSVSLQLSAASPNNPIFNGTAAGLIGISWVQNDGWQEGTGSPSTPGFTGITFSILQGLISGGDQNLGTLSFNGATNGSAVYALGLPSGFVTDALSGSTASFRLFAADSTVSGMFNSRNFGTAANRPVLTIEAVPEPGTLGLSLAMLGALIVRRTMARQKLPGPPRLKGVARRSPAARLASWEVARKRVRGKDLKKLVVKPSGFPYQFEQLHRDGAGVNRFYPLSVYE